MNKPSAQINRRQILASLGLILTTVIWGSGFVVMKNSLNIISPIYLMAFRFSIASMAMAIFFFPKCKQIGKKDWAPGIILGGWLCISYILQTYGLKHTTASNNAFITTFYVILVPFLDWLINKYPIKRNNIVAASIALVGIGFLSLDGSFTLQLGDGLTLLCSLTFAVHIIFIERYTRKHDPIIMTIIQMLSAAVICWICGPIFEGPLQFAAFSPSLAFGLLYLGLFGTMLCFLFQTVGQKYLSASTASLLLSLECVFGAVFSIIFLNDPITVQIIIGFILVFGAVFCSQVRL